MDFTIPSLSQSIRDLELVGNDDEHENGPGKRFYVRQTVDVEDLSEKEQVKRVDKLEQRLQGCEDVCALMCEEQDWFEELYSFLRFFEEVAPDAKCGVIDVTCQLANAVVDFAGKFDTADQPDQEIAKIRTCLKVSLYLVAKICFDEETNLAEAAEKGAATKKGKGSKKKATSEYDWNDQRQMVIECLLYSLKSRIHASEYTDLGKFWSCGIPEESFLDLFWRTAENVALCNPKIAGGSVSTSNANMRDNLVELVVIPVHKFHSTISHLVTASFTHTLNKHDNMPSFLVSVMLRLLTKYNDERLPRSIILEIGRLETHHATKDLSSVKNLGQFIETLATDLPTLVLSNLSVLLTHLNAYAYPLRNSIIRALSTLIVFLKDDEIKQQQQDEQQQEDQGEGDGDEDHQEKEEEEKDEDNYDDEEDDDDGDDEGGNKKNATKTKKKKTIESNKETRDRLFDLISERVHDTSSYVRAVAVAAFTQLSLQNGLPLSHIHIAVDIAVERILDKSSLVRKQAIACLTTVLENNPYSDRLDPSYFKQKLLDMEEQHKQRKAEAQTENKEESEGDDDEEEDEEGEKMDPETFAALTYYKSALTFTARMEVACEQAEQLVCSKIVNDVVESIRFLGMAVRFKLPAAKNSLRKMLGLIWDDRESGRVKKELLEVFELVFISEPMQVGRTMKRKVYPDRDIAENLIQLVLDATLAELTNIERVIAECVSGGEPSALGRIVIPTSVIEKIWEVACTEKQDLRKARAAMCLVALTTDSSNTLFEKNSKNVDRLVELCEKCNDFETMRHCFIAMSHLYRHGTFKKEEDERVERILSWLLLRPCDQKSWFPATEEGIRLLVLVSNRADLACARMVRRMHKHVFGTDQQQARFDQAVLSQLFFVVGHVSVQLFVYAEKVTSEAKRHRKGKEDEAAASAAKREEMMMLGGGATDDFEDSVLERIADVELVEANSLLGQYLPLIMETIRTGLHQNDEDDEEDDEKEDMEITVELMESATLAFCKMLCLSHRLCERSIRLLFTVLRDCKHPTVRSNVMIAVGDLAVRFPNVIEPFTSQIYIRLRDPHTGVRKTALMVLTHLILNDMIKLRGEVFEIALCLEDQDERIKDLACLFFHELSRKGLVVNHLLDMVNKLSKEPEMMPKKFQRLAKFLFQFVTAEKQVVALTEKLCQRLFTATGLTKGAEEAEYVVGVKESHDLAYCLTQLKHSQKSIHKLSDDLFKLYQPLLADDIVYDSMQTVIKKGRQLGKQELKQMLEEWGAHMDEIREKQLSNKETTTKAASKKKKTTTKKASTKKTTATKTVPTKSTRSRRRVTSGKENIIE